MEEYTVGSPFWTLDWLVMCRTLLHKLEEMEASLEACGGGGDDGGVVGGAIPKRRQKARKPNRRSVMTFMRFSLLS